MPSDMPHTHNTQELELATPKNIQEALPMVYIAAHPCIHVLCLGEEKKSGV